MLQGRSPFHGHGRDKKIFKAILESLIVDTIIKKQRLDATIANDNVEVEEYPSIVIVTLN